VLLKDKATKGRGVVMGALAAFLGSAASINHRWLPPWAPSPGQKKRGPCVLRVPSSAIAKGWRPVRLQDCCKIDEDAHHLEMRP